MKLRSGSIHAALPAAACFLLGLLIATLGIPRFVAGILAVPGDAVRFHLYRDNTADDDMLQLLIDNRQLVLRSIDDPDYSRDIGAAATLLSFRRQTNESARSTYLRKGEAALAHGLGLAPVDPYSWARLAYIRQQQGAAPEKVSAALRMSLLTGTYDPELTRFRLLLALPLWAELSAEDRRAYMAQIRVLWRDAPEEVSGLMADPRHFAIVLQALASEPGALDRLQRLNRRERPIAPAR